MCTQHLTSTPKLCNDTSTAKNSSYCFNYQASLDGNVDGKILQILEDLLNLFDGCGKRSQGIKDQVNECFQNIHITSESRLTGQFSAETIFNLTHRVLTDTEIKILEKDQILLLYNVRSMSQNLSKILKTFVEARVQNAIFGTSGNSLVTLEHFQQNLNETLSEDTPAQKCFQSG